MAGPLNGITVLDFTWALAGPYGVMVLADLGAEVWKIEPPGQTEDSRGPGPMAEGINTYYFSVNRGKHSLCLDLKTPEAKQIVYALARQADVLTQNFRPGVMARLGFDYERMATENPRLIYASLSGFGQYGPYRDKGAVDIIVQGMGGVVSITGHPDGPPARPGYSIGDMGGGLFLAIGVLAALEERHRSGAGQHLDVSMLDAQLTLLENAIVRHCATGEVPGRIGTRHPLFTPLQAFPCADGYIVIANTKDWPLFCAAIGRDDLIDDPRFQTNTLRTQHHAVLEPILNETFCQKPRAYWLEVLENVCLIGPMNTVPDVVNDQHTREREMVVEISAWNGARLKVANTPMKYSRTPSGATAGPDRPGGFTAALLRERLGYTDAQIEDLAARKVIAV
jgi:CoA:oxalate CoA-transferase